MLSVDFASALLFRVIKAENDNVSAHFLNYLPGLSELVGSDQIAFFNVLDLY